MNHVEELIEDSPALIRFDDPEYRVQPALIITNIAPGSYAHHVGSLMIGNIISEVNGMPVATLQDWSKAIEKSLETGFVAFKTDHDVLTVLLLEKILMDEIKLSEAFAYPVSETVKKLQQSVPK
jgi:hypothetical protein